MRVLAVVILVLLLVPGWAGYSPLPILGREAIVTATPVALDPADPSRRRVGRLTYLGGVRLDSPDPAFGGVSGMTIVCDRFTLLSDGGNITRFRMGADWRPRDVSFDTLPAGPGTGWLKEDRDSESLTRDPATGRLWVGFERANEIWRYAPGFAGWQRWSRPPAMRGWRDSGGAEAMARLRDGRFIVISEKMRPKGSWGRQGLFFAGDPTEQPRRGFRFIYWPPKWHEPSDIAQLPDGRLLILNRKFKLPLEFQAALTVLNPAAIRPGERIRGEEIATLKEPLLHDNFEALVVTREGDATIVWLASDDNELALQQTLLLKFRLDTDI